MNSKDIFSLNGKNILLTGATGHLGRPIAFQLAKFGANVIINSRSKKNCINLVNEIRDNNLKAELAVFDITKIKEISKYINSKPNFALDCLINNAYNGLGGTIQSTKAKAYLKTYNDSVISVHNLATKFFKNFKIAVKKSGGASIINIGSMYGMVSPDLRIYDNTKSSNPPFYGTAKAALLQWTRYAACEFAPEKIRVNSISPGAFPSSVVQKKKPYLTKKLKNKIPLGRIGQPKELCGLVVLLASNASSYITGENITVDGGWTAW